MASLLVQTIDALSREKGIEPQIIISAVEDALLVAARKFYKTNEDLRSALNRETGQIEASAIKTAVDTVTAPVREISLADALKLDKAAAIDSEVKIRKPT